MSTRLSLKFKEGKFELVGEEMPDLEEAKRLWMEGKSAQFILEQARRKKKGERA